MKNKGITLVALVVTIVVLLILAGVSINLILGENGLINNAKEAKNKTLQAEKDDEESMDATANWIIKNVANLPQTTETKPYIPSSEFSQLEGTNLSNGLVIQDREGNQYVWIEVPIKEEVYKTAGLNITEFNVDTYTKIENDLHDYAGEYRKSAVCKDEYIEGSDDSEYCFKSEEEYNAQKYKMLKSVYQNGGFWVGRYEAGIDEKRTESGEATLTPKSKQNLYPYNFVTRVQAKRLAEQVKYKVGKSEYNGSLLFGIQWDLILKFIETNKIQNDSKIIEKLKNDSTEIGNHKETLWSINSLAKYSINNGADFISGPYQKNETTSILLTTGTDDKFLLMNIYDIAGNVREWTLENNSENISLGVYRGGAFCDKGADYPASSHRIITSDGYSVIGFRVSIY